MEVKVNLLVHILAADLCKGNEAGFWRFKRIYATATHSQLSSLTECFDEEEMFFLLCMEMNWEAFNWQRLLLLPRNVIRILFWDRYQFLHTSGSVEVIQDSSSRDQEWVPYNNPLPLTKYVEIFMYPKYNQRPLNIMILQLWAISGKKTERTCGWVVKSPLWPRCLSRPFWGTKSGKVHSN